MFEMRLKLTILKLAFVTMAWGQTEPKVKFMYPDDWFAPPEKPRMRRDTSVVGIYENKDGFRAARIQLTDTLTDDSALGLSRKLYFDSVRKPLFIISGANLRHGAEISGLNLKGKGIFPGNPITYSIGTKHYTFLANGKYIKNSENVVTSIADYEVVLRVEENTLVREETLYKTSTLRAWDGGGFEGGVALRWIGDLDNDNGIDIILTTSTDYRFWEVILFMTSRNTSNLVNEISRYSGSAP